MLDGTRVLTGADRDLPRSYWELKGTTYEVFGEVVESVEGDVCAGDVDPRRLVEVLVDFYLLKQK